MFLNISAAVITILVLAAILKQVEVRLALLTGGLLLTLVSWNLPAFSDAFAKSMVTAGLIQVILPVMGFAAVMQFTGCDRHLVRLVTDPLLKVRAILVPGAVLATFVINIAIPSAAGCGAAVGVVLIPAMIAAGVHPATAGAAVLAGTWGSVFSPGLMHNPMIAKIASVPVMNVILSHKWGSAAALVVVAALLFVEARLLREDRDWAPDKGGSDPGKPRAAQPMLERVNVLRALIPVLPLALLLLTWPDLGLTSRWLPKGLTVLEAMVIGVLVGMAVTRTAPGKISSSFFDGMGRAYGLVLGIIICAGVFIGGLEAAGVVQGFIETLKASKSSVPLIATFGPMLLSILTGSADAVTLAFNTAVTPHAAQFGMTPVGLGSLAMVSGSLGRSMSPVAAVAILVAGMAGVNSIELTKRNALPMLIATITVYLILGH
ncbi:MAG TPA: C4-dicarboxylate transporter DcuC [Candidatus Sulfotelmatobacter sp.]|nr:C4-dicarboxylate transporter DcuC [Candidatus Sulfotelmatobacter sp.]